MPRKRKNQKDQPFRVDRRARVIALHQKGLTLRDVARQVGISYETCRADLADAGIETTNVREAIPARREKVAELFREGVLPGQIAARMKCTERVVRNDLWKQGFSLKGIKEKPVKVITPSWEDIDTETVSLLIDAARLGSVSAAVTLNRISEKKRQDAVEAACETHVDLSVAGEMLLTCAQVYAKWIGTVAKSQRLDGANELVRELIDDAFDSAHGELTRAFEGSETKAAVLKEIE